MNSNQLKMIVIVTMFIDHLGMLVFPDIELLRIIGRLTYPVFAFFIAEGCLYTRSIVKYFFRILGLGVICMLFEYIFDGTVYGNILITFSLSILIIGWFQRLQNSYKREKCSLAEFILSMCFFVLGVAVVVNSNIIEIDYGIVGILIPVAVYVAKQLCDNRLCICLVMLAGLTWLSFIYGGIQFYCLLAVLLLLMYNNQRGKLNLKYVFYLFYPLHFVVIECVRIIVT